MKSRYCQQASCTRMVFEPHLYCAKHVDLTSNPYLLNKSAFAHQLSELIEEYLKLVNKTGHDNFNTDVVKTVLEPFSVWLKEYK